MNSRTSAPVHRGKRASLARANARIRRLVLEAHALVDEAHARPLPPGTPPITCTAGCSHAATGCCSTVVLIEMAEAELIVERNRELVEQLLPALIEADRRIRAEVPDYTDWLNPAGMRPENEREVAGRYHAMLLACPFLDAGNRCRVYRDRPLPCRTHEVLSDPVHCTTLGEDLEHVTLDRGTRTQGPMWLVSRLVRERKGELLIGALPQAVLEAYRRRARGAE